jgi:hypothetical protein
MTAMIFDLRRIGRVAHSLVAGSAVGVESRHRRRRSTSTGTIEQKLGHDPPRARGTNPTIGARSYAADAHDRRAIASDTQQRSQPIGERVPRRPQRESRHFAEVQNFRPRLR